MISIQMDDCLIIFKILFPLNTLNAQTALSAVIFQTHGLVMVFCSKQLGARAGLCLCITWTGSRVESPTTELKNKNMLMHL